MWWNYTTLLRVDSFLFFLLCEQAAHIKYITFTDAHYLNMAARLLRVCMSLCEGNLVPWISITGSQPGVSPHTKDAGRLEALGPNRGRDRRGKRKLVSASSATSILTYIIQSGKQWSEKWNAAKGCKEGVTWQKAHVLYQHKTSSTSGHFVCLSPH